MFPIKNFEKTEKIIAMKKIVLLIVLALFVQSLPAQLAIHKWSISSQGGSATSSGGLGMVFTVGELAVREYTSGGILLSESFVGPDIAALDVEDYELLEDVMIYPNPVEHHLYVRMPETMRYEVRLVDMNGKEVMNKQGRGELVSLDISSLSKGTYLLLVIDRSGQKMRVFKVEKH